MTRPRRILRPASADPGSIDPASVPRADARRRADSGTASARWRALLEGHPTVLADGAMGTMLFSAGLQFGDPPEVWNLTQPEVVRRIHRAYLAAGSLIVLRS